jgi:hypothetical protein
MQWYLLKKKCRHFSTKILPHGHWLQKAKRINLMEMKTRSTGLRKYNVSNVFIIRILPAGARYVFAFIGVQVNSLISCPSFPLTFSRALSLSLSLSLSLLPTRRESRSGIKSSLYNPRFIDAYVQIYR